MTAANEQIVAAFELNNLTPEQIAEQLEYDVVSVKAVLLQNSSMYRKEAKQDDTKKFSDNEADEMKEIILNLARYSEDENLKFKCARYVRDDHLGRLDIQSNQPQLQQLQLHVVKFQQVLNKALDAQQRTLKQVQEVKQLEPAK